MFGKFKFFLGLCLIITFSQNTKNFAQPDSTNLPLFVIDTKGSLIVDEPKINAHLKIIYDSVKFNHKDGVPNIYNGDIGIEIRGRYSALLPQKPYGFETRDSLGENLNVPLFHMPSENDWILLANYNDKTFMRNSLTFELFRQMGHYAPRTQFCEVLVNGFYQGIYVFTEKIKRDKGRVDIARLNQDDDSGDDLTGGYIFKVDYYDESNSWTSQYPPLGYNDKSVHFVYHYPEPEEITNIQKTYLQQYVDQLETTLYASGSQGLTDRMSEYIDVNSFVDYFILNELARNVDAYKKSAYFYKDKISKGGKLKAGPVWDFDWAWKNINECFFGATDGSGWAFAVHQCDPWPVPPSWTVALMKDVRFVRKVKDRYTDLRNSILSETYIYNYIDSVAHLLDEAQARHYTRWPILGQNVGAPEVDPQPTTYAGEIEKFKTWISKRLNWLDTQFTSVLVTGLEDQMFNNIIPEARCKIYPNPAATQLKLESDKQIFSISVYSNQGQHINPHYLLNSTTLDLSDFSPGLYVIKTVFTDGTQWTGNFIIEQ